MNKLLLTISAILMMHIADAQKTEFTVQLNSGLFSFYGITATKNTVINYSDGSGSYTNNPYSLYSGLCIGISGDLKRVSKQGFIVGVGLGIENLRSKSKITAISIPGNSMPASGHTYLNNHFVNLYPYMGCRVSIASLPIDITGGFDAAFCINTKERGKATASNDLVAKMNKERTNLRFDFRPRLQIATHIKRYGMYVGYSLGLINYQSNMMGGDPESYSRMLRFGLSYQLK